MKNYLIYLVLSIGFCGVSNLALGGTYSECRRYLISEAYSKFKNLQYRKIKDLLENQDDPALEVLVADEHQKNDLEKAIVVIKGSVQKKVSILYYKERGEFPLPQGSDYFSIRNSRTGTIATISISGTPHYKMVDYLPVDHEILGGTRYDDSEQGFVESTKFYGLPGHQTQNENFEIIFIN